MSHMPYSTQHRTCNTTWCDTDGAAQPGATQGSSAPRAEKDQVHARYQVPHEAGVPPGVARFPPRGVTERKHEYNKYDIKQIRQTKQQKGCHGEGRLTARRRGRRLVSLALVLLPRGSGYRAARGGPPGTYCTTCQAVSHWLKNPEARPVDFDWKSIHPKTLLKDTEHGLLAGWSGGRLACMR